MRYADTTGRRPDFRVRYQWLAEQPELSKPQTLFQHLRCDFAYADDGKQSKQAYMIWPEFETAPGVPLEEEADVPFEGIASMWILDQDLRTEVHRARIRIGVGGFMVVGMARIAAVDVVEVVGLFDQNCSPGSPFELRSKQSGA